MSDDSSAKPAPDSMPLSEGVGLPRNALRPLRVGGLTRLSTADYPGELAAVVFCQGCPWRCGYCHNPHLIPALSDTGARDQPRRMNALGYNVWLIRLLAFLFSGFWSGVAGLLSPAKASIRSRRFRRRQDARPAGSTPHRQAPTRRHGPARA